MKITLHNFQKYREKTFKFPNTGLVVIKGVSGAGKSTIFRAIEFALYCPKSINFHPAGKRNARTVVKIQIRSVIIVRSSNPLALEIDTRKIKYIGDEAQDYINKRFGTHLLFKVSSYSEQLHQESLVFNVSSEQSRILEALLDNGEEELRRTLQQNLERKIREKDKKLNVLSGEIKELERRTKKEVKVKRVEDYSEEIKKALREKENLTLKLKDIKKKLSEVSRLSKECERFKNLPKIGNKEEVMTGILKLTRRVETVENQEKAYEIYKKLKKIPTDIIERSIIISQAFKTFGYGDYADYMQKVTQSEKEMSAINEELKEIRRRKEKIYKGKKKWLKCPQCSTLLKLSEGSLEKANTVELTELTERENDLEEKLSSKQKIQKTFENNHELVKKWKKYKGEKRGLFELQEDSKFFQKYKKMEESEPPKTDSESIRKEITKLNSDLKLIEKNQKDIARYEEIQKELSFYDIKNLTNKKMKYKNFLHEIEPTIVELEELQKKYLEYASSLKLMEVYENDKNLLEKKRLNYSRMIDRAAKMVKIKEVLVTTAADIRNKIVDTLKLAINGYVDDLLEGYQVELQVKKKLEIIVTTPDGNKLVPRALSGGEQNRLGLIFTLALNDWLGSSILILDETLSGVDSKANRGVFEKLEYVINNDKKRLILVVQHGLEVLEDVNELEI